MKQLTITLALLFALAQPAFAGWYLLLPPTTSDAQGFDPSRPYSEWHILRAFDLADECNQRLDALKDRGHCPWGGAVAR
jgi:hypothetical protein